MREGAPTGFEPSIPILANGVFPKVDKQSSAVEESRMFAEMATSMEFSPDDHRNYRSYYEYQQLSEEEVDRLEAMRYVIILGTWAEVLARWAYAVATRLASIVKLRTDGSTKLRFVMDLLRSGVNGRSLCPERVVLPRLIDMVNGNLDLMIVAWRVDEQQVLSRVSLMVIVFFF